MLIEGVDVCFNTAFISWRRSNSHSRDQPSAKKFLRIHLHPSGRPLRVGVGWIDESGLFGQCEFYTEINR